MRVPPPVGPLGDHVAAVRLGDLANDGEAEPGAGHSASRTSAIEAIEDEREILVGDARAVVANDELPVAHGDLDFGAGWAPLRCVVEQVSDRTLERRRDSLDRDRLEVDRIDDFGPIPTRALDFVRDEQVEAHFLRLGDVLLGARELDELGDEHRHLTELLDDVREEASPVVRRQRAIARENFDVRADARERRPELM